MPPDARRVVGEQVDRDRRDVGDRRARSGCRRAAAAARRTRRCRRSACGATSRSARASSAAVVQPAVDRLVLPAAVHADQAPGQVVVHGRLGARRDDQREQRERAVLGAIERVLPDAAAHAALPVRRRVLPRAASRRRPAARERRLQRLDARPRVGHRRGQPLRLVDERADLRGVDEIAEGGVVSVMAEVTHRNRWYTAADLLTMP